jgi:asparagine synthase (glutamine-hydrolysing)
MSGIFFGIINKNAEINLSNDFLSCFNNLQKTDSQSIYEISENINLSTINPIQLPLLLSRRQIQEYKNFLFVFGKHTLLINDTSYDGHQPLIYPIDHYKLQHKELMTIPQKKLLFTGEIYNYIELQKNYQDYELISDTDCQVILPMYNSLGITETLKQLKGEYSFVLTDNINTMSLKDLNVFIVRDRFGTKPMYIIYNTIQEIYFFASQLKCIPSHIASDSNFCISQIPAGSYWSFQNAIMQKNANAFINYYNLDKYKNPECIKISKTDPETLMTIQSTLKNLITNSIIQKIPKCKFGILLSGGFDSTLISTIVLEHIDLQQEIHFFTLNNNTTVTDTIAFLESKHNILINHHQIDIDLEEIMLDLPDIIIEIITILEIYDPDTIRDAIPLIYLFDYIHNFCPDIKVLLSGDCLDEIANGYLQSNDLCDSDFLITNVDLINNITQFDILRTEKMSSHFGIEMRYPFLDTDFIEYYLTLSPKLRRNGVYMINNGIQEYSSKFIIRKSFADTLPFDILWKPTSWSAQSIDNLELSISQYYHGNEIECYKQIYNGLYFIKNLKCWQDLFNKSI